MVSVLGYFLLKPTNLMHKRSSNSLQHFWAHSSGAYTILCPFDFTLGLTLISRHEYWFSICLLTYFDIPLTYSVLTADFGVLLCMSEQCTVGRCKWPATKFQQRKKLRETYNYRVWTPSIPWSALFENFIFHRNDS